MLIKHRDATALDEEYNSEDYLQSPQKSNSGSSISSKEKKAAGATIKKENPVTPKNTATPKLKKKSGVEPEKPDFAEDNKKVIFDKHEVLLTNLSKIYWPPSRNRPDEKITKGDLLAYYENIAPYILPYLKDRPLSLKRNPNGILDEGFFHKNAGESAPSWVKKAEIHSESNDKVIHYIMCNDTASLLYIANLGSIEINPWNSTYKKPGKPGYMVIDIDPSDKNSFEEVIETAMVVKNVLDKVEAVSVCKTSGASGLHVYVPLGEKYTYDQVLVFAKQVAVTVQQTLPGITSIERSLKKRGNKIYIDYLQNHEGQTLASAYSVRPKPGATVSTPLEWKEIKPGLHPSQFTIHNIAKRLSKKGDLFEAILKSGIDLKKCIKRLEGS